MTFSYRGFWRGSGALAVAIGKIQKYSAKENIKNKAASEELRDQQWASVLNFE